MSQRLEERPPETAEVEFTVGSCAARVEKALGRQDGVREAGVNESAERAVALEPEPDMRARAEGRARRAKVPVGVVDGDGMALPFHDSSFDTVVTSLVLCTIPDPGRALGEVGRVLGPGGTLRFQEHVRSDHPRISARQDRWCRPWRWFGRGCHSNRAELIENSGFRRQEIEEHPLRGIPSTVAPHVLGVAERV